MGVFISHIEPEASLASVLKDWVESAFVGGVKVFVSSDGDDVTAGDQWFQKIGKALTDAKVLLVICSTRSVHRPWINFETGAGHIKEVPVIPICHTGMTRETLPTPLSFFQALDTEEDDFENKLMAALAKHLDFPREPRIPYQEMKEDVQDALSRIAEKSGQSDQEEEMGFLDHLVSMQERIGDLTVLISTYGEDATEFSTKTSDFVEQRDRSRSNRYLRRIAKKFGEKGDTYARKVERLNNKYERVLPEVEQSLQYVIRFQKPNTEEDWRGVSDLLSALESSEKSLSELKEAVLNTRMILENIPNYQEHMNRAIKRIIAQYKTIISNLDGTLEMFQKARVYLKSLER